MTKPRVIDMPLYVDDRGTVHCAFDNMHNFGIKRTYIVRNWSKGMIRAWHGHLKGDTYMHVISGAVKVAAKPIQENLHPGWVEGCDTIVATITAEKPQMFLIPAGWFNGAVSLTDDTKILVYSTHSFERVKDDDVRGEVSSWERRDTFGVKSR